MEITSEDAAYMQQAINLALLAEQEGNLPIGTVIVLQDKGGVEGRSAMWIPKIDATRYAEIEALRWMSAYLWHEAESMRITRPWNLV